MIISVNGQRYDIENWDEFSKKLLYAIGFQAESEMITSVNNMRLVDTGRFKSSFSLNVQDSALTITNSAPYASYLEYGTYDYWRRFGKESYPETPDPKKKDISRKAASALPKGMQPFAVFRRTLWNQNKMNQIITKAVKIASK